MEPDIIQDLFVLLKIVETGMEMIPRTTPLIITEITIKTDHHVHPINQLNAMLLIQVTTGG